MRPPSRCGRSTAARALAAALLVLAAALPVPSGAAADDPPIVYPEAAGTTIVHGQGVTGVTLRLPEPIRLFRKDLTFVADPGTRFAWLGFRVDEPRWFCDFCFPSWVEYYAELSPPFPDYTRCSNNDGDEIGCPYDQELLELYIVSDGPVTLTVRLPNLDGATELTASAGVDGFLEQLPARGCSPLPDCSMGFSYGGRSRVIGLNGRPAMAAVVGYVIASRLDPPLEDSAVNPYISNHVVCAYPSSLFAPNASGDPDDHPRGCDDGALPLPSFLAASSLSSDVNWKAHGEQYLGYSVWSKGTLKENVARFWGFWLESGMSCPSRDFHDCNATPA